MLELTPFYQIGFQTSIRVVLLVVVLLAQVLRVTMVASVNKGLLLAQISGESQCININS